MKVHISPTGRGGYAVQWEEENNLHISYTTSHYEALMLRDEVLYSSRQYEGGMEYEVVSSYEGLSVPPLGRD